MFALPPKSKCLVAFAVIFVTSLSPFSAFAANDGTNGSGTQVTTNDQIKRLRHTVARLNRGVASLRAYRVFLTKNLTDVKGSLSVLNQNVIAGKSVQPSTPQTVIGSNKPSPNYISFDFYPGVQGEAVVQHTGTGVAVSFKTKDSATTLVEYSLALSFEGRTNDQKAADNMMINACLTNFYRAADSRNGGTFFIYPSADDKIGLACSSVLNP